MYPGILSLTVFISLLLLIAGAGFWRLSDHHFDRIKRLRLLAQQPADPRRFTPSMVSDLPEPARRYFEFSIQPGTPLYTVAEIFMAGKFGLGSRSAPGYMAMKAEQVISLPTGFIWTMRSKKHLLRLSGSDSEAWTRFWLMGLLPVARLGNSADHARSAFGRYAAESVFWTPASLLPRPGVQWQSVDENTARVIIEHNGMLQPITITVAADGSPRKVCFLRWSNAGPDKVYRLQPFGGYLSAYRDFDGFRLATHIEAGNFFETESYFPFFIADVTAICFPKA